MGNYLTFGATVPNGGSLSPAVDLRGFQPLAIQMPAAWTAASITFEVSDDGTNFADLYNTSGEYSLTVAVDRAVALSNPNELSGFKYIKVRSGTSGTPVNQGADRIIKIIAKE
jgi:hypothetical protein